MAKIKAKKERMEEEIRVMVHPSLYKSFKDECDKNYKTISEVIRDMILTYTRK